MKVLTPFVNMLSTIVTYATRAAQAVALLFGVNLQFSSNTGGGGAVAEGWDDATDSIGNATGAANKYKKLIEGFDELNIMSSSSASGRGGGGGSLGSGGFDVGSYFDIKESQAKLLDFNKWLSDIDKWLVKAQAQFKELGIKLGNSFNNLVNYVNWGLLGKTIIDGFNNVFTFVNNYFNTADFINFGSKLGVMVNKGLKAINPKEWGQALVNKLNAAWQTAYGFVSTLNWGLLGTRFQEIIRNAFDSIDINSIADTISTTLNGIKTVILGWADTFPIVEMGKKIWSVIDRSLSAVDWKGLGQSLNKLITQLFQALRNIDYSKITKSIADFLDGLNLIGLFKDYVLTKAQLIGEGLVGLFSTPSGAALGLVGIISILGKAISNLSNGPLGTLNEQLFLAFNNFKNFGLTVPKSISNIIGRIKSLNEAMGETSAVDFLNMKLEHDVLPKLSSMVNNLGNSFKLLLNPVEALKVAFNTLQGAAQSLWQLLLANPMVTVIAAVTALVGSFIYAYQHSEVLRDNVSKIWEQFKNFCSFIIDQVKIVWDSWLKPLFDNLKQTITNLMNKVITPLWELISSVVSKIITILNATLKPVLGVLLQWFNTVFFGSISWVINTILTILNGAIGIVGGLINSVQ